MSLDTPAPPLRSWLFVPGDSERKQARALESAADALILDLEDSVAPPQRAAARERVAALLSAERGRTHPQLWVRVSGPGGVDLEADLKHCCKTCLPAGIVLPKVSSAQQIISAAERILAVESGAGPEHRLIRLVALVTETPEGLLALPEYPAKLRASRAAMARLTGLTWGAEDLSAALGASAKRDASGAFTFTFQLARASCLLAAAALGVQAIDTVHTDLRNSAALDHELGEARRDGFSGKLAVHPDQLAAINAAFTPSPAELEHAQRVVAAFADAHGAGVVSLDGQMIDRPHLLLAQRILAAPRDRIGA